MKTSKRRTVALVLSLTLALLTALAVGGTIGGRSALAARPQGTALGTAFTYQGRLTDTSGNPIAGPCDLRFTLYESAAGADQVGAPQTKSGVTLNDGYFTVDLDFGSTPFTGDARWLEITIDSCSGGANNVTLSPRIALSPTPYAMSLRPGAAINGDVMGGAVLEAENTYIPGSFASYGIQGTGYTAGVYGQSSSSSGYGIYSDGNAHVEGNLTWQAKTSYISIPAAAFTPNTGSFGYANNGFTLGTAGVYGTFYAPVQLPHGATVTGMDFYWYDSSFTQAITCTLRVDAMGQVGPVDAVMAQLVSTHSSGWGRTGSIDYATVDNEHYIYYLKWEIDGSSVLGRGVVIEYTFTEPY